MGMQTARALAAERASLIPKDTDSACGACHQDDAGKPLPVALVSKGSEVERERVEFRHDLHTAGAVRGGCFACHTFDDAADPFRARPSTRASVSTCVECHDASHRSLRGGVCARCHRTPEGERLPLVYRGQTEFRDRPVVLGFSHFANAQDGHASVRDCRVCHAGIERATDASEIPVLSKSGQVCVDCHIDKGYLFHFERSRR